MDKMKLLEIYGFCIKFLKTNFPLIFLYMPSYCTLRTSPQSCSVLLKFIPFLINDDQFFFFTNSVHIYYCLKNTFLRKKILWDEINEYTIFTTTLLTFYNTVYSMCKIVYDTNLIIFYIDGSIYSTTHIAVLILLLLLLKKIGNARPGEGDWHPISPIISSDWYRWFWIHWHASW